MHILSKPPPHALLRAERLIDRLPHLVDIHDILCSQLVGQLESVRLAVLEHDGLEEIPGLGDLQLNAGAEDHAEKGVDHGD